MALLTFDNAAVTFDTASDYWDGTGPGSVTTTTGAYVPLLPGSATATDLIIGALLNINSYSPGETLQNQDAQVGLTTLNNLLDSLSNDESYVFCQQETTFSWVAGQYSYNVGNPVSTTTFVGSMTAGSPTITTLAVPPDLIASTTNGSTLVDLAAQIPSGTTLNPFNVTAIAATSTTITMSANALSTVVNDTFTYTVPGDIPMNRPLRFREGFTRAATGNALDFTFKFTDLDNYKRELLKNVQGPWPYIASYNPTMPYGKLLVYPAPGAGNTAHIFSDYILSNIPTVNTVFVLPQGYRRSLIKLLALELAPIYMKTPSSELKLQAKEAKMLLQGTNSTPSAVLQFDSALTRPSGKDAGWITHGGFS